MWRRACAKIISCGSTVFYARTTAVTQISKQTSKLSVYETSQQNCQLERFRSRIVTTTSVNVNSVIFNSRNIYKPESFLTLIPLSLSVCIGDEAWSRGGIVKMDRDGFWHVQDMTICQPRLFTPNLIQCKKCLTQAPSWLFALNASRNTLQWHASRSLCWKIHMHYLSGTEMFRL